MRRTVLSWFVLCALACLPFASAGSVSADWCTIESPDKVGAEQKFTVKVTIKDVPAGLKLGGDLHFAGPNGNYGGYAKWGGNAKAAKTGDVLTLTYTMPPQKEGMEGVNIFFYLSAKGFNEAKKKANSAVIKYDGAYVNPNAKPDTVTFKKSWIKLGTPVKTANPGTPWVEGDEIVLPIEYYVDPADDWGGTSLSSWVVGPWIDNPVPPYSDKRTHVNYPGLGFGCKCEIGKVTKTEYKFKLPKPFTAKKPEDGKFGDSGILIFFFKGKDGKNWPWQVRQGFGGFARKDAYFTLDAPTPGNLFTYDQPVVMHAILGNKAAGGGAKTLVYSVTDTAGAEVAKGEVAFTAGEKGQIVKIPLDIKKRGTFMLAAKVDGWENQETTFARVPDVKKIIGTKETVFGGQKFDGPEATTTARMLGMSITRLWISWSSFQPLPNLWNEDAFVALEKRIDELNKENIKPWLLFDNPPHWAIKNPKAWGLQFCAFPFDDKELETVITKLAERFKDKIIGFEWQNEIVPGKISEDPVGDYVRFCKVANTAVKKINPNFKNQLAGGLWPNSFRKAVLAAGVADYIDILPVHYGTGTAIDTARADLAAVGATDKLVWDNETAHGHSTWKMPISVAMKYKGQGKYIMSNYSSELIAGCPMIVVFGNEADACGNWSTFWGDMSPRPGAATMAVLASKIGTAKPLGDFTMGKGATFRLFANGKKPVLVAETTEKAGETVSLPTGKGLKFFTTDDQGNETDCSVNGEGVSSVPLLPIDQTPVFAEGGDLEVLEAQLVARVAIASTGVPQLSFVEGVNGTIPMTLKNYYDRPLKVKLALANCDLGSAEPLEVSLKPGETQPAALKFNAKKAGSMVSAIEVTFDYNKLPKVMKSVGINVINPDMVGNLLKNPGFEEEQGGKPAEWAVYAKPENIHRLEWKNAEELGHQNYVVEFKDAKSYISMLQGRKGIPPGKYVYSMWIKSKNQMTGSNAEWLDSTGKKVSAHWLRIFQCPKNQDTWEIYTKVIDAAGGNYINVQPISGESPGGVSWIDNARLTFYEGTEYNAEAPKAGKIKIDGDLSDFNRSQPIPLLGRGQLHAESKGYKWTPQNLSAVAYLNWDTANLYVGVEAIDDNHVASKNDEKTNQDDSVEIAIHPLNRQAGEDGKAFVYYLSMANPGGGSGKHTLFRPAAKSGGLKAGSLTKDSSMYDVVVKRNGNKTVYELAIPFAELGGIVNSFGTKFGLSLAVNDNDGSGYAASMVWGEGLKPKWSPSGFGMMVLGK